MPVYEYACKKCSEVTEALRKMDDADAPIVCEHCGSDKTHRAHSVFAAGQHRGELPPMGGGGCGRCGDPNGMCGM